MSAPVTVILDRKGRDVVTVVPDVTLMDAARTLTDQGIGALVVSSDGLVPEGVLSERDIVRELTRHGADALGSRVGDVMTRDLVTCHHETSTDELMATMTEQRIRHVPVVDGGQLAGIVSIGDVVKWRMDELADEAARLEEYVTGSR